MSVTVCCLAGTKISVSKLAIASGSVKVTVSLKQLYQFIRFNVHLIIVGEHAGIAMKLARK